MFITNHVLAGALVGAGFRRRPAAAFAAGVATHVVMDLTPHWGDGPDRAPDPARFYRVARRDGLLGLAAIGAITVFGVPPRGALLAGIAGAAVLDADKPVEHFFGRNPFPDAVNRFHGWIQNESPDGLRNELLAGALLGAVVWNVIRAQRARRV